MILDISKDVPTYHAFGPGATGGASLTVCGRVIDAKRVGIPTKHARKFAKECRGCFPQPV